MAYLRLASAPLRDLAINAGACALGLFIVALPFERRAWPGGWTGLAGGVAIAATAVLGTSFDGAARWIIVSGLLLQPGAILVPLIAGRMLLDDDAPALVGVILAAVGLAAQPDRALAGALAAAMTVLVLCRPRPRPAMALAAAACGFAVTLARPDTLPAMPFVEGVLRHAGALGPAAGLAAWGGSVLLLVPALIRRDAGSPDWAAGIVFGATWLATIVASLVGTYPTPVIGYGASAIIGYLLSTFALPRARQEEDATPPPR